MTDFGIARAGASDMTETGSIMGTAQYLSPEQAQGHNVSAGSDLYSIGIVLYEMLTGRVPFDAESAVTIALKHVSEAPPPPSQFNPNIPAELEQTVLWVLNKNASDRPTDADQLITVLEHCREAIASAGAGQHTASMAAVAAAGAAAGAGAAIAGPGLAAYQAAQRQTTNGSGEMMAVTPPPEDEDDHRGWAVWGWVALVILLIAAAAAGAYLLTRPQQVVVPKVTGEQVSQARTSIEQAKFQVATVSVSSRRPRGIVVAESPVAGTKADKGSTVTLSVSSGPSNVSIPPVQGLSQAAATRALRHAGLRVSNVVMRPSNQFPAGQATGTTPGVAHSVPHGYGVTLFVSSGATEKAVPNVIGETQTQAVADLTRAGFTPHSTNQPSSTETAGNVISQSPVGNTKAPAGSDVTIVVASAPATVQVPPVIHDPPANAASALRAAGFRVAQKTQTVTDPSKNGVVISQSPSANSTATKGTTVTITVGKLKTTATTTTTTSSPTTTTTPSTPTTRSTPSTPTTTSPGQ